MDLDGDGRLDVISGSWPGSLHLFSGQAEGGFAKDRVLEDQGGKPLEAGKAATVFAADWDGDGDLDLLVGNIEGDVTLIRNEGSREAPAFAAGEKLSAGKKAIKVPGGDAGPAAADWDGDGDLDLLVGTGDGAVLLFENEGAKGEAPRLAAARTLVAGQGARKAAAPAGQGKRAKICVVDWNRDGRLDLLLGDFTWKDNKGQGHVYLFLRRAPATEGARVF